jgi:hypothetical protein
MHFIKVYAVLSHDRLFGEYPESAEMSRSYQIYMLKIKNSCLIMTRTYSLIDKLIQPTTIETLTR